MAKKKDESNVVEFGHNSGDPEVTLERQIEGAMEIIEEIEAAQAKIDQLAEEYKSKAAPSRDEIASLKKRARDDFNIEAKPLALYIQMRRQERRIKEKRSKLEGPAKDQMDMFLDKYGEAA